MPYKYFVVTKGSTPQIVGGWGSKEDAKDHITDLTEDTGVPKIFKVLTLTGVKRAGLDPTTESTDWRNYDETVAYEEAGVVPLRHQRLGALVRPTEIFPTPIEDEELYKKISYDPEGWDYGGPGGISSEVGYKVKQSEVSRRLANQRRMRERKERELEEYRERVWGGTPKEIAAKTISYEEYEEEIDPEIRELVWAESPEEYKEAKRQAQVTRWEEQSQKALERLQRQHMKESLGPENWEVYKQAERRYRDPDDPRLYENWEWEVEPGVLEPSWDYEGPDEMWGRGIRHDVPGYGTFSILEKRDEFIIEHDGEELGKYRSMESAQYHLGNYVKDIGANPANLDLPGKKDGDMPWKWLVGGLGLFAIWWLMKESKDPKPQPRPIAPAKPEPKDEFSGSPLWRKPTVEDEEYLAKVIVKEAGDTSAGPEWGGIAWVAINRANRKKVSIKDVVAVTSWPGGGPRGRAFVADIKSDRPMESSRYPSALDIASSILRGEVPNPIGKRRHFVHKRGLKRCNAPEGTKIGKFICIGGRKLPAWIVGKAQGGLAGYTPIDVGRATFA